jgi:bifunctional non-homologous end joining protein LigD
LRTLREYRSKRNFRKTSEPASDVISSPKGRSYVVQKHDASHLHYDFRLEHDGVLLSWAIPKGPSLVAGDKRLAVHVEDHPLEYGSFEGTIPEGEYGGGTVMVWDCGQWEPLGDPEEGMRRGRLEFRLHGEKLRGAWLLTRMGGQGRGGKENWLLIKRHDEDAREAGDADILEQEPSSAASGRSLPQIAAGARDTWASDRPGRSGPRRRRPGRLKAAFTPADLSGARKRALPAAFAPQLASLTRTVPDGDDWVHEIKFDGYRMLCFIQGTTARLITRNGNDWTERFPVIAGAARQLGVGSALLDGEIVAPTGRGAGDFQTLQNALREGNRELVYYVFDLPYLEGYDLARTPLLERKAALRNLLVPAAPGGPIRYCDHVVGNGAAVFRNACRMGMEGIVCKRADSPYAQTRSRHWLKIKCSRRQEFVICGYTDPGGSRAGFGALLLACHEGGRLTCCGKVGTGFDDRLLRELHRRLLRSVIRSPPVVNPPTGRAARGVHWVRPELVAEVEFTEWTSDGMLRHPSFQGLREDKPAGQVVRERPVSSGNDAPPTATSPRADARSRRSTHMPTPAGLAPPDLDGLHLTNPDRILYPEQGITKRQLAEYYATIASWILPHIVARPLALVRCPRGRQEKCFFQKHLTEGMPESILGVPIPGREGVRQTVFVKDLAGLLGLVQVGVLEIHTWGSRVDEIEKPDRLVFDLDPGPGISWEQVCEGAIEVCDFLGDLGLATFTKATGGKGLHVLSPINRRQSWDELKEFTGAIARLLVQRRPDRYVATMTKSRRQDRIYIDFQRNGRGATFVAPYSTRARAGAPVSTPISRTELEAAVRPDEFTLLTLPTRLARIADDPWKNLATARRTITASMLRRIGR